MLKPILHFLVLGALLFALDGLRSGGAELRGVIAVDDNTVERLRRESIAQIGRAPTESELAARIDLWIDEEILYREARSLGLDRIDPVVRSRLVRNMRFLADPDDPRDDETFYRDALELGMDRTDLVVRRRMVQQMRFLLEAAAAPVDPSDEELRAFVAGKPERYRIPPRVRLSHVFLSRDRRKERLDADARALLVQLRRADVAPDEAREHGDPFLHPSHLGLQSEVQIAKQLGPAFAVEAMTLDLGRWAGPVESAYGMHLVWVHARDEAREPELDTVRRSALSAMQAERNSDAMRRGLDTLRERYAVDSSASGGSPS